MNNYHYFFDWLNQNSPAIMTLLAILTAMRSGVKAYKRKLIKMRIEKISTVGNLPSIKIDNSEDSITRICLQIAQYSVFFELSTGGFKGTS